MSSVINVDLDVDLKTPRVPNFIITTDGKVKLPVGALSNEDLAKLAVAWRQDLLDRATEQRKEGYITPMPMGTGGGNGECHE